MRVCGQSIARQGDADDDSRRWLHFGGLVYVCRKSERERERGGKKRRWKKKERDKRNGDNKKMKSCSVPSPEVICRSDPRLKGCSVACVLLQPPPAQGVDSVYVSYSVMMSLHSKGWRDGKMEV